MVSATLLHLTLASIEDKYYFAKTSKGPHIIRHSLLKQTFKLGYPLKLYCEAEGLYSPQINWYKNGVQLSNDHRTVIKTERFRHGVSSRLQLVLTRILDAGLYDCVARDDNGIHMREFRVDYKL
ncbi:unnamed protein product [Auanema sp. JU1783]|nr:unnamed protein product [Auanema sp. JU1783]